MDGTLQQYCDAVAGVPSGSVVRFTIVRAGSTIEEPLPIRIG